jgi:carboxymethylenebutenolidase
MKVRTLVPAGLVVLVTLFLALSAGTRGQERGPVTSFLQEFMSRPASAVMGQEVRVPSAIGPVTGYLARPEAAQHLPAVLLLPDERGLTDWMRENARDLAGTGFVVLALDLRPDRSRPGVRVLRPGAALADEKTLAQASAAVRWLRRRPDVSPERVGVVGWSWGGEQALALAAATSLQACAICDAPLSDEPSLLAGLRGTPVLAVVAGLDTSVRKTSSEAARTLDAARVPHKLAIFERVRPGFMGPEDRTEYMREAADRAWFEVYEFLDKYVEDAAQAPAAPILARTSVATIADIMRAVNQPTGVRGTLIRALAQEPSNPRAWHWVRANAALVVEAGRLLETHTPKRGTRAAWQQQIAEFTADAEGLVAAADRQDYREARRGLEKLAARCAVCHEHHR